jgi:hypothetical protein
MELPESLSLLMSGVSRDGVLECPAELGERDDPDSLESRPPATASSCSSILKEGIEGWCVVFDTGFRCSRLLDRLEWFGATGSGSSGDMGGRVLFGGVEVAWAIVLRVPIFSLPSRAFVRCVINRPGPRLDDAIKSRNVV